MSLLDCILHILYLSIGRIVLRHTYIEHQFRGLKSHHMETVCHQIKYNTIQYNNLHLPKRTGHMTLLAQDYTAFWSNLKC